MTVKNFPEIKPSYGNRKNVTPNVAVIKLGDGYEQRQRIGLNFYRREYD